MIPRHVGLLLGGVLIASPVLAQLAADVLPPITSEQPGAAVATSPTPPAAEHTYTTKKMPFAKANADTAPLLPKPAPATIPFGKSTASSEKPISDAPHTARAVPVENVDAIETGEPAPAEPPESGANPVAEDPAMPTELSAPIFSAEQNAVPRSTIVRVLNKVTARSEKLELKPGRAEVSGKLRIAASHCQHSEPSSLADDAALITISEIIDAKQPDKPLFSGWMYQSSPSINGLEHPIYDVSLVACKDAAVVVKPAPVVETKPVKKKSKP